MVLAGIDAALQAGLHPVKINAVLIRGRNDDEVDDFIALTRDKPLDVRLIELMPLGGDWASCCPAGGQQRADRASVPG